MNKGQLYAFNHFIDTIETQYNTLEELKELLDGDINKLLLNGAKDWEQYSWDGNALVYDEDIKETFKIPADYEGEPLDYQAERLEYYSKLFIKHINR